MKSFLKVHWVIVFLCWKTSNSTYSKIQTSIPWLINSYMIRPSWPLQLLLSLLTMWSEAFCTLYFECSVSLLLISRMASSSQSGLRLMVTCSEMPFLTTSPKQLLISLTPPLITLFFVCLFVLGERVEWVCDYVVFHFLSSAPWT